MNIYMYEWYCPQIYENTDMISLKYKSAFIVKVCNRFVCQQWSECLMLLYFGGKPFKGVHIYEDIRTRVMAQRLRPQSLLYSKDSWCTIYHTVETIHIKILLLPCRLPQIIQLIYFSQRQVWWDNDLWNCSFKKNIFQILSIHNKCKNIF